MLTIAAVVLHLLSPHAMAQAEGERAVAVRIVELADVMPACGGGADRHYVTILVRRTRGPDRVPVVTWGRRERASVVAPPSIDVSVRTSISHRRTPDGMT
jgi:hypothetical protein